MAKRKAKRAGRAAPLPAELTVGQAARFLKLSVQRIRQLIADKRLPARKIGPMWLIERGGLRKFAKLDRPAGRPPL